MNRRPLLLLAYAPGLAEKRGARLFQPALSFSQNQRQDALSLCKGRHEVLQRYAWAWRPVAVQLQCGRDGAHMTMASPIRLETLA